jgi:hypothetical protein
MSWFYNLKTMKKLQIGFALVALGLPVLGYIGLTSVTRKEPWRRFSRSAGSSRR